MNARQTVIEQDTGSKRWMSVDIYRQVLANGPKRSRQTEIFAGKIDSRMPTGVD